MENQLVALVRPRLDGFRLIALGETISISQTVGAVIAHTGIYIAGPFSKSISPKNWPF